jgi:hypothetical protein
MTTRTVDWRFPTMMMRMEKARSATPRRRKALGEYYLFPLHVLYDTSHFRLLRILQEGKGHLKSQKTFKRLTFWYDDVSLLHKNLRPTSKLHHRHLCGQLDLIDCWNHLSDQYNLRGRYYNCISIRTILLELHHHERE